MSLYLVRDGERLVCLALERDHRLYSYLPAGAVFIYNGPLSIDFLIDHELTYEPLAPTEVGALLRSGALTDPPAELLDELRAEPRRVPADLIIPLL